MIVSEATSSKRSEPVTTAVTNRSAFAIEGRIDFFHFSPKTVWSLPETVRRTTENGSEFDEFGSEFGENGSEFR
jgi:hypothetical protein